MVKLTRITNTTVYVDCPCGESHEVPVENCEIRGFCSYIPVPCNEPLFCPMCMNVGDDCSDYQQHVLYQTLGKRLLDLGKRGVFPGEDRPIPESVYELAQEWSPSLDLSLE